MPCRGHNRAQADAEPDATIDGMTKPPKLTPAACPCASGLGYPACCGAWHLGWRSGAHAPTPEALMRSRYSAYVLGCTDYLRATWHPSTAPGELELSNVKWLGLEVRRSGVAADTGMVEFVARWRAGGRAQRLHESSRFVREGDRWYYLDGQMHETR